MLSEHKIIFARVTDTSDAFRAGDQLKLLIERAAKLKNKAGSCDPIRLLDGCSLIILEINMHTRVHAIGIVSRGRWAGGDELADIRNRRRVFSGHFPVSHD